MSDIKTADHSELITFADFLVETGAFTGPGEVVYFFEKPWKWQVEFDAWKAAEPKPDPTWETEEMSRWIANDEVLYHACKGADATMIEQLVKTWIDQNRQGDFDVNLLEVDWDQVAADAEVSA